jgi:hypothetical protein
VQADCDAWKPWHTALGTETHGLPKTCRYITLQTTPACPGLMRSAHKQSAWHMSTSLHVIVVGCELHTNTQCLKQGDSCAVVNTRC